MSELRCSHLRACALRLDRVGERLERLVADVPEAVATARPAPKVWSVVECVDHLAVTAGLYRGRIDRAIRRGRERGVTGTAPFGRGTWLGRMLLANVTEVPKRKIGTPGLFEPPGGGRSLDDATADLMRANDEIREWMRAADGLDLGRLRVASPVSSLMRMSLAQAFDVLTHHELRHLGQAERAADAVRAAAPTEG